LTKKKENKSTQNNPDNNRDKNNYQQNFSTYLKCSMIILLSKNRKIDALLTFSANTIYEKK